MQSVVIIGGSSGIGAACIARYLEVGARVFNLDIQPVLNSELQCHPQLHTLLCDITQDDQLQAAFKHIVKSLSDHEILDALIISAGVHFQGDLDKTPMSKIAQVFEVNILGVMRALKAFVPLMKHQRSGAIVLVGSDQCFSAKPEMAAYSPSKGALASLTRSLALELGPFGVRINCVCPGATQTPMLTRAIEEISQQTSLSPESILQSIAQENPLGRVAIADEVAAVICFVASPEASFIHGALIPVDGGMTSGSGTNFSQA